MAVRVLHEFGNDRIVDIAGIPTPQVRTTRGRWIRAFDVPPPYIREIARLARALQASAVPAGPLMDGEDGEAKP